MHVSSFLPFPPIPGIYETIAVVQFYIEEDEVYYPAVWIILEERDTVLNCLGNKCQSPVRTQLTYLIFEIQT